MRTRLSAFTLSFIVHLLFVGVVAVWPTAKSLLPVGVNLKGDPTVIELGSPTSDSISKKRAPSQPTDSLATVAVDPPAPPDDTQSESVESATDSESKFGSKSGTAMSGKLGVSNGSEVSDRERYIYELRRLIDGRKFYPALAKRMRQTGKVLVQFDIHKDGKIDQIAVIGPSQHERLNAAASQLISSIRAYKPLPDSTGMERLTVTVPVDYALY